MATTFFKNTYEPQVSFQDVINFCLVLNNPTNKKQSLKVCGFDNNNIIKEENSLIINSFNTKKICFNNEEIDTVKIESNFVFCRPVIIKEYESYFDIFHS